ncbi:hypothetical protein QCA50_000840 [Cerrena zonata]|uniref:Uncharacterized protein n=1 Tax=Cerrena zonata TaxID=2478898 RepID=A0AAW0H0I1_9APHY
MPPRAQPKTFILTVKTHKLTILVTLPATSTVNSLKEEVLSGLNASSSFNQHEDPLLMPMDVDENDTEWEVPTIQSVDDFELAKAVKEKGRHNGNYETLDSTSSLKSSLLNWDSVFLQFKDQQGKLEPVKVSLPSLDDDDEEEEIPVSSKGKRKARRDELEES